MAGGCQALATRPPSTTATPAAGWARWEVNGRGCQALATRPPSTTATPAAGRARWEAPGWRRSLQPALAALWLRDAVLQYQTFMFSQGFPRMLAATASGNPGPVAGPVTWSARLIGTHPGAATAVFGT